MDYMEENKMELTAREFSICNRYKVGYYPVATVWYKHGLFRTQDSMTVVYLKAGKWYYNNSSKRVRNIFLLKILNAEQWLHLF